MPSAIPCSLSPIPLVSVLVVSRTGGVLSHRNSLTHRFVWILLKNLCSFVTLAVRSLVFVTMDTAYCQALISLELAESRILHKAPVDIRPTTSLISFCTVQLRTLCTTRSVTTLCLSPTSGPGPDLGRGRVTTTTPTVPVSSIRVEIV